MSAAPTETAASGIGRTVIWWMIPARLIGRIRPILGSAVDADTRAFARWPAVAVTVGLPLAAILLALVPSIIHATSTGPLSLATVDYFRIRVDDVYTESLPFMAGALVLGVLSPALGAFLVIVFGVFDLIAASMQPQELVPLRDAVVGRLVSYWLLWLLAVEVPMLGRALAMSARTGAINRVATIATAALVTGGFAWLWSLAAGTLIRATITLSFLRTPQAAAIFPVQHGGWVLGVIGALAVAAVVATRGPSQLLGRRPAPIPGWDRRDVAAVRHVVVAALLTVCLIGVIGAPWHALVLFAALVAARPLARLIADRSPVGAITQRVPATVLVGVAAVAGIGIALAIVPSPTQGQPNTFDRVVLGIVVVMLVGEILTTRPAVARRAVSPAIAASLGVLSLIVLSYVAPAMVYADNCADPADCYGLGAGAALAAAAAGAFLAAKKLNGPPPDPSPPPLLPAPPPPNPLFPWDGLPPYGRHDETNWAPDQRGGGPCVLTTACVTALGKQDDCHELETFRRLREEYLRRNAQGVAVIDDYYRTSPEVVAAVQTGPGQPAAWRRIYGEFVEPVVQLADAGRFEQAADLAVARYGDIKLRYGVS